MESFPRNCGRFFIFTVGFREPTLYDRTIIIGLLKAIFPKLIWIDSVFGLLKLGINRKDKNREYRDTYYNSQNYKT